MTVTLVHLLIAPQKHVIDVSLQEGRRFLYEGHHSMAIPAALEALKFLTEVYGNADIHLTPAYLLLAEAAIGLGRLTEADQYLSQVSHSQANGSPLPRL